MLRRIIEVDNTAQAEKYFIDRIEMLKEPFGVLLLLYSVVCTKGISGMRSEISDPTEPIIDSTYGYGSQSLINLMLTGRAVGHVWDHDQDIGGLSKRSLSIPHQSFYHVRLTRLFFVFRTPGDRQTKYCRFFGTPGASALLRSWSFSQITFPSCLGTRL